MIYGAGKLGVDELASGKNGVRAIIMQLHVNDWFTWKLRNRYVIRNICDREAYTKHVGLSWSHVPTGLYQQTVYILVPASWPVACDVWSSRLSWYAVHMSRYSHLRHNVCDRTEGQVRRLKRITFHIFKIIGPWQIWIKLRYVIFKLILLIDSWGTFCETSIRWM